MPDRIDLLKQIVRLALDALWPDMEVEGDDDQQAFESFANAAAWKVRRIKEREAMGWRDIGNGKKRWDPTVDESPEERAQGAENIRAMVAARQAPSAQGVNWDPTACMMTAGLNPRDPNHRALAEHMFPTQTAWEGYKAKRGLTELTQYDLKHNEANLGPASAPTKAEVEADAREDLKEALAHMSTTGQLRNGELVGNAAFVPMATPPANGNGMRPNPSPAYRPGYADIPDASDDPSAPVIDPRVSDPRVEAELRAMAAEKARNLRDPNELRASLEQDAIAVGLARARERGAFF